MTDKRTKAQDGFDDMNYQARLDYKHTEFAGIGGAQADISVNPIPTYYPDRTTAEIEAYRIIESAPKSEGTIDADDILAAGYFLLVGHISGEFSRDVTARGIALLISSVADLPREVA